MVGAIASVLGGWPGPSAWRHLHRATRNNILELAKQGKLHPDKHVAAIAVEWARWRRELSPWRQLGIAIATIVTMQAAIGLLFLLLMLIPGGETTYDGSPLRWVQIIGGLVLAIWRLVMVPSSAAYEILRLDALTVEHDEAEPTETAGMSTPREPGRYPAHKSRRKNPPPEVDLEYGSTDGLVVSAATVDASRQHPHRLGLDTPDSTE